MPKALVITYVTGFVALVVGAVGIWRLRCEGFGCIGVGVAWFAWVASFIVLLGVGLLARSKAAPDASLARTTRVTWWLQLTVGALAAGAWLARSAT